MKKDKLYGALSVSPQSRTFYLDRQTTFVATGMFEGDEIHFEVLHLTDVELTKYCGCLPHELPAAAVAGIQTLLCTECDDEHTLPVRMTHRNPTTILEAPFGTLMRAVYVGAGLGTAQVTMITGTSTKNLDDTQRGCPPVCCEDFEQTWRDTGVVRCDLDSDTKEVEQVSNCGNYRWILPSESEDSSDMEDALVWEDTERIKCDLATDSKLIEQVNECGNTRWILPSEAHGTPAEEDALTWELVEGEFRCDPVADTQEIKQVNECGNTRWILPSEAFGTPPEDDTIQWEDADESRCNTDAKQVEHKQVSPCGNIRWVIPEEPVACGHIATIPLPDGGMMFEDGKQPDDATVAVEDCDGNILGWLYPEPRPGASTAVFVGCGTGAGCAGNCLESYDILGYAVNGGAPAKPLIKTETKVVSFPKQAVQAFTMCDDEAVWILWSDGSMTKTPFDCTSTGIGVVTP